MIKQTPVKIEINQKQFRKLPQPREFVCGYVEKFMHPYLSCSRPLVKLLASRRVLDKIRLNDISNERLSQKLR